MSLRTCFAQALSPREQQPWLAMPADAIRQQVDAWAEWRVPHEEDCWPPPWAAFPAPWMISFCNICYYCNGCGTATSTTITIAIITKYFSFSHNLYFYGIVYVFTWLDDTFQWSFLPMTPKRIQDLFSQPWPGHIRSHNHYREKAKRLIFNPVYPQKKASIKFIIFLKTCFVPIHGFNIVLWHFLYIWIGKGLIINDWVLVNAILVELTTNDTIKSRTFCIFWSTTGITVMKVSPPSLNNKQNI